MRHSVLLSATAEGFGRREISQHRVRNLSSTGACVDNGTGLRPRGTIVVTVGHLVAIGAQIVWIDQGLAGMKFNKPIQIELALAKAIVPPKAGGNTSAHHG